MKSWRELHKEFILQWTGTTGSETGVHLPIGQDMSRSFALLDQWSCHVKETLSVIQPDSEHRGVESSN